MTQSYIMQPEFDGQTYQRELDYTRMRSQVEKVKWLMTHPRGQWWTLSELASASGASESGVSARIRDLRKEKHGTLPVASRRSQNGLWRYCVLIEEEGRHAL